MISIVLIAAGHPYSNLPNKESEETLCCKRSPSCCIRKSPWCTGGARTVLPGDDVMENIDPAKRLADKVAEIRARMDAAARASGRDPADVSLCAACKARSSDVVRLSAALDIDIFGENRMQEMQEHMMANAFAGKPCHFIGKLQNNKVRHVVGKVSLIQSVDSLRLLDSLQREAARQTVIQDILFEINLGEEESKAGAKANSLRTLMDTAAACPNLKVRGLMAIPPVTDSEGKARRYFSKLRELLEVMGTWRYANAQPDILSMGMSDSYEAAIREGATIVRIGRGIYGE